MKQGQDMTVPRGGDCWPQSPWCSVDIVGFAEVMSLSPLFSSARVSGPSSHSAARSLAVPFLGQRFPWESRGPTAPAQGLIGMRGRQYGPSSQHQVIVATRHSCLRRPCSGSKQMQRDHRA